MQHFNRCFNFFTGKIITIAGSQKDVIAKHDFQMPTMKTFVVWN